MNSFGRLFRIHIFGESHNQNVGIVIDGCPCGIKIDFDELNIDLERRKANKKGTTKRKESDIPIFISGVINNTTTGTPITVIFENKDIKSKDYDKMKAIPRPGHADFTASNKYKGFNDLRGGGHFSGRLTLGLVVAGYLAKKIINPVSVNAKLIEVKGSNDIDKAISDAIEKGDSVGGIIECIADNMPVGLGEPFFDSVESTISHLIFSIPGIRGIEFGSGFKSSNVFGSECNDIFINSEGKTETNNAGGINGGISNGNPLMFKVAVKPTSSISRLQNTYNFKTKQMENFIITGRHDACFALRVPVIVESFASIALADLLLINKSLNS